MQNEYLREIIKFGLVGLSGVVVNFVVVSLARFALLTSDEVAFALGITVSVTTNYVLNRVWTFRSSNPFLLEYFKYILSNLAGIVIQFSISVLVENAFEANGWEGWDVSIFFIPSILISLAIGIVIGSVANFLFSKYLVFNPAKDQSVS